MAHPFYEHPNDDPEETAELRHKTILLRMMMRNNGTICVMGIGGRSARLGITSNSASCTYDGMSNGEGFGGGEPMSWRGTEDIRQSIIV